ncbi:MAG TPA: tRNA lysidine(34) synthetase TilS, partial [Phycisphaerae bacterium]|nr:tRNA lysidine(34) synthetase TilS [Phycisphaerae bacterium]
REGLGFEEAARNARRAFLADAARRAGARKVALGHTADDRAETVLFNIVRGTGVEGLAALGPRATLPSDSALPSGSRLNMDSPIEIIRPLIEVSRAEVLAFLESRGERWREDETNADTRYARNRLRHEVLPLLREAINPKADEALGRLADQAAEAADVLADALEETWRRIVEELPGEGEPARRISVPAAPTKDGCTGGQAASATQRGGSGDPPRSIVIDADDFTLLRPWLQGAILRRAVERLGGGLKAMSAERTRAAVEALLSGSVAGPVELPGGLSATRRRRAIRIGSRTDNTEGGRDDPT